MTEDLSGMGRAAHVGRIKCRKSSRDAEFWVGVGRDEVEELMQRAKSMRILNYRISHPNPCVCLNLPGTLSAVL